MLLSNADDNNEDSILEKWIMWRRLKDKTRAKFNGGKNCQKTLIYINVQVFKIEII